MSRRRSSSGLFALIGTLSLIGFFVIGIFVIAGLYTVKAGQYAVETTGGKITSVEGPGWRWAWPIIQGVTKYKAGEVVTIKLDKQEVYYSPDYIEKTQATSDTQSNNAQQYTIHWAVIRASIQPEHLKTIHTKYRSMENVKRVIQDAAIESYKAVVREIDPLKINTQREVIGNKTRLKTIAKLDEENGIVGAMPIYSIRFINFEFEKGVKDSYESANRERAAIQEEQYARERAEISVEKERLAGKAVAIRITEEAQGKANAIAKEGEALRKNPSVITLRAVEKWAGDLPKTMLMPNSGDKNPLSFIVPPTKTE